MWYGSPVLSIGWIIFWKAVILGIWASVAESWLSYRRKRRAEMVIPMAYSRLSKGHVENDWTAKLERFLIRCRTLIFFAFLAFWAFLAFYLLTGRKEELRQIFLWLFSL